MARRSDAAGLDAAERPNTNLRLLLSVRTHRAGLQMARFTNLAALQTEQDGSTSHKTLRNGVVMPTIAAGTGGYDNQNQQGKVLRNGLVMPTMSAGTWQYDDRGGRSQRKRR